MGMMIQSELFVYKEALHLLGIDSFMNVFDV